MVFSQGLLYTWTGHLFDVVADGEYFYYRLNTVQLTSKVSVYHKLELYQYFDTTQRYQYEIFQWECHFQARLWPETQIEMRQLFEELRSCASGQSFDTKNLTSKLAHDHISKQCFLYDMG